MISVIDMVRKGIKDAGGEGLCRNDEDGCGCGLDDLAPCGQVEEDCVVAHRKVVTQDDIDGGIGGCMDVRIGDDWFYSVLTKSDRSKK